MLWVTRSKRFLRSTMICHNVLQIHTNPAHSLCKSTKQLNHQFTSTTNLITSTKTIVVMSSLKTQNNSLVRSVQRIKSRILAPQLSLILTLILLRSFWMGSWYRQTRTAQLIHVVSSQRVSSRTHTLFLIHKGRTYQLMTQTSLGSQTENISTKTEQQEITWIING